MIKTKFMFLIFLSVYSFVYTTDFRIAHTPSVKNIFLNLPTLETERLILRPIQESDTKDLFEIYSNKEVLKLTPVRTRHTLQEVHECVLKYIDRYQKGKAAPWVVVFKKDNKVIGLCGFIHWIPKFSYAEIAGVLEFNYWDNGLMTEAKKAIITCAFEVMNINRIQSHVYIGNEASLKVNEKLGFKRIGIIPEYAYYKGAYRDCVILSLLKSDFITHEKVFVEDIKKNNKEQL